MDRSQRKAAVAAAKEDKVRAGIYAVRGAETGAVWVGRAPNLASVENRLTFALRTRSHACRSLQAAWDAARGRSTSRFSRRSRRTPIRRAGTACCRRSSSSGPIGSGPRGSDGATVQRMTLSSQYHWSTFARTMGSMAAFMATRSAVT